MQDVQDELNEVDLGDAANANSAEEINGGLEDIAPAELWYDR